MYYILQYEHPLDANDGYYFIEDGLEFDGIDSWALGTPFRKHPPNPIVINLIPVEGYKDDPPEMHDAFMLLMSNQLVATLKLAGANNIDCYPALLCDRVNGRDFHYQAVNIVGLVSAADLNRSKWENLDGDARLDTHFDQLTLDKTKCHDLMIFRLAESTATIVIHGQLKNALVAAGLSKLRFTQVCG